MRAAPLKIAIVGSGISGLAVAHTLQDSADVSLFEAASYFGGHTHTVDITLPTPQGSVTHGVDTGFLVFNERTYPNLINLLAELDVHTSASEMSFSVQVPGAGKGLAPLEWSGNSLSTVFAQRGNLLNWRFLGMLGDLLRFNRLVTRLARQDKDPALMQPLGDFLRVHKFGDAFRNWYFLPMLGCIWSCPTDQMLQFPVATMVRFCHNHGLVQIAQRPQWNYERAASSADESAKVCLHYLLNRLQPLPFLQPVMVSLNPTRPIDPQKVHGEFQYAHPVFDLAAIRAQTHMPALQGQRHTYYAGAWMGYGFHEDGLKAGLGVSRALLKHLAQPMAMAMAA